MITDSIFETVYNPSILTDLAERFGDFRRQHFDISVSTEVLQQMADKMRQKPRRGEVVMLIPNPAGHVWLHTKDFYPEGVYRLMTGGLETGENPRQALRREAKEETGFTVKIERCLAAVTYTITIADGRLPFVSYLFLTTPVSDDPAPTDPDENITHFKAMPPAALFDVARQLRSLHGKFADWGAFRAIAHEVAADCLNQISQSGHYQEHSHGNN